MNNNGSIIAIIPARSTSKEVRNKNIVKIKGKELISYTICCALKSKLIDRVIVSTDSKKYAKIASQHGAEVPFLRPKNISLDKSTDITFFKHALDWLKENENILPKLFVHLRPTTPFRNPKVVDTAIKEFLKGKYTALRSCHVMSESSYKTFEIKKKKLVMLCSNDNNIELANRNRQLFPTTYNANGYIDIIKPELILKKNMIHGNKVLGFITEQVLEVDSKYDLERLEYEIKKKPILYKRLFTK
jgi:N-acylneuraminate cytidylyltransferase|tara:strand:+ start:1211 stop:1945 length:735 start_codon:yes stop_codon:yes gene_type:complete